MTSTIGWILFLIATMSPDPADRVMTYSQYADCEKARNEWLQGPILRAASACIPVRVSQPGYTNDDYTAVVYYDSRWGKLRVRSHAADPGEPVTLPPGCDHFIVRTR